MLFVGKKGDSKKQPKPNKKWWANHVNKWEFYFFKY